MTRWSGRGGRRVSASASAVPAAGLWPPSSQSSAGPGRRDEGAAAQALEAGGPFGAGDGGGAGGLVHAEGAERAEGDAGVADLVGADEVGQRQVEEAVRVEVGHAAVLLPDLPVLAFDHERGEHARRLLLDDGERLGLLAADHAADAVLEDAGLLGGDLGQGLAEVLLVVDGDGGDDGEAGAVDDVGGVEAAAEADLEQGEVGRGLAHGEEGGGGGDLEEGDGLAGVGRLAAFEGGGEVGPRG